MSGISQEPVNVLFNPSIVSKDVKSSSGNNTLILVSIIIGAIAILLIIRRIRKTSRENKILKEDL